MERCRWLAVSPFLLSRSVFISSLINSYFLDSFLVRLQSNTPSPSPPLPPPPSRRADPPVCSTAVSRQGSPAQPVAVKDCRDCEGREETDTLWPSSPGLCPALQNEPSVLGWSLALSLSAILAVRHEGFINVDICILVGSLTWRINTALPCPTGISRQPCGVG